MKNEMKEYEMKATEQEKAFVTQVPKQSTSVQDIQRTPTSH